MPLATKEQIAQPAAIQRVRLRYLLGEFKLFSFSFPAQVEHCFLVDAPPGESPLTPPDGAQAIVRLSEALPEELPRFALLPKVIRYVPHAYRRYYVELSGGFAAYLAHFSGKTRNTLNRKVRKFSEAGGALSWRRYSRPEEMSEFHAVARGISARTYQEQLLDAGLPDTSGFRNELEEAAATDRIRGYILFSGETPAAYAYCKATGRTLTYELLGHDPAFLQLSPGTVLLYQVLEDLFERDTFEYFDFGGGEASYKEFFSTGSVHCADVYYFRKSLRNALMVQMHRGLTRLSDVLVKALDAMGVKDRVKRFFRASCS